VRINELICAAAALLAALAVPVGTIAQDGQVPTQNHRHYKLIDMGTFGGPNSSFVLPSPGGRLLNNSGEAAGGADTSTPDPSSCLNFDCYLSYGFQWQDGFANQLSALPGFNSSFPFWISDTGLVAGLSENGIDPLTGRVDSYQRVARIAAKIKFAQGDAYAG